MHRPPVRHIIGCMTGTSLDGLDAVLTRVEGAGPAMRAQHLSMTSRPLGDLADTLRSMAGGEAHPPIAYLRTARRLGELHADACAELAGRRPDEAVDFVVAHGQTICHAPRDPVGPMSWQLFDPWPIVRRLGAAVCYDLRQADLVAGGGGAPITPIADPILYRDHDVDMVVNLGGIMNVTAWTGVSGTAAAPEAGDVCPCNLLLDGLVQRLFPGQRFDRDGALAARGRVDPAVLRLIEQRMPIHDLGRGSLGREQCTGPRIDELIRACGQTPPHTILRSAVALVARAAIEISRASAARGVILAGGGARNRTLVAAVAEGRDGDRPTVRLSDEVGIPCEAREAMAFAVLGALSHEGIPIALPHVTGATTPALAGAWAPARPGRVVVDCPAP